MQFKPKTEDEIQRENLLEEGAYPFQVVEAAEGKSKKGNDMITVKLRLYRPSGGECFVFDYLLEAMAFKLLHFCEEVGLADKYEAGTLTDEDCVGKEGMVMIGIQDAKGGYPAKNVVADYGEDEEKEPAKAVKKPDPDLDAQPDDIPF
jgi:hypothetical protein